MGAPVSFFICYNNVFPSQALADLFFDRFEVYSTENQLNTKMEHQKLHEIFQNIKRENNTDLRRRIVTGEMKIDELIAADVKVRRGSEK